MKITTVIFIVAMLSQPAFSSENKMFNSNLNVNPHNTAVILIEFQKTWTEKGFFHWLIGKEYKSRNVQKNTIDLIHSARRNGIHVIQAPLILDKEDKERYGKIPFLPKLLRGFTKDTWKSEFTDGIYEKTDAVVMGRCGFDATECSNLEEILKDKGIKNLFFCGLTTDHCVESTMKTLNSKGYKSILVSDCTAARNAGLQRKIENRNITMTSAEVIKHFEATLDNR